MNRLLVAPWHGLIKGGQVHLPNGDTQPFNQPPNNPAAYFGPGDTHRITVPNVAALTPEELAATPAGGEYRTGEALISGNGLYSVPGLSWIYQDPDGSKWAVQIISPAVFSTFSRLTLKFSRFGVFGPPVGMDDVYEREISIPKGWLDASGADLNAAFFGWNTNRKDTFRLHAVSLTGRTVILTLSMAQIIGNEQQAETLDARPRHYLYVKLSLARVGDQVEATPTILYTSAQIRTYDPQVYGGFGMIPAPTGASIEISRDEVLDGNGVLMGYDVSYNWPAAVPNMNMGWGGLYYSRAGTITEQWIMMVVFDGETPVPCTLSVVTSLATNEMTFTKQTLSPRKVFERVGYISWANYEDGAFILHGSGSFGGSVIISWQGPGADWSETIGMHSSASFNGYDTTVTTTVDGETTTVVHDHMHDFDYPELRLEQFNYALPNVGKYLFCAYSNNLVAALRVDADGSARFIRALTSAGSKNLGGDCPADQRHYGSYNPITGQVVAGSTELVNWA